MDSSGSSSNNSNNKNIIIIIIILALNNNNNNNTCLWLRRPKCGATAAYVSRWRERSWRQRNHDVDGGEGYVAAVVLVMMMMTPTSAMMEVGNATKLTSAVSSWLLQKQCLQNSISMCVHVNTVEMMVVIAVVKSEINKTAAAAATRTATASAAAEKTMSTITCSTG